MLGRRRDDSTIAGRSTAPLAARGGVSIGAILTGVVVAFGAMFLLTAIVSGILYGVGLTEDLTPGEQIEAGLATGIGLVIAQFVSYMWGGYAAGRMSRGAGAANGALVALLAVVVGIAIGAIAAGIGATEELRTPFNSSQLPADGEVLTWGAGLAIAALVAMFAGAITGGALGSRWHTKLERRAVDEHREGSHTAPATAGAGAGAGAATHRSETETIDLRDRDRNRSDRGITTTGRRE